MNVTAAIRSGSLVRVQNEEREKTLRSIEQVSVGDQVLTLDGWRRVLGVPYYGFQKVVRITHKKGVIECTTEQRLAVLLGESIYWKRASELSLKDELVKVSIGGCGDCFDSKPLKIKAMDVRDKSLYETYSLTVESSQSFLCQGVLVESNIDA